MDLYIICRLCSLCVIIICNTHFNHIHSTTPARPSALQPPHPLPAAQNISLTAAGGSPWGGRSCYNEGDESEGRAAKHLPNKTARTPHTSQLLTCLVIISVLSSGITVPNVFMNSHGSIKKKKNLIEMTIIKK